MCRLCVSFVSLIFAASASAELGLQPALQTCGVLKDTKLNSRGLITAADGDQTCMSQVRSISPSAKSTLSFGVESRDEVARKATLTLRIQPGEDEEAKRELIKAGQRLSVRTLGSSMPHSVHQSITSGSPSKTAAGSGFITVTKTKSPDSVGYMLVLVME